MRIGKRSMLITATRTGCVLRRFDRSIRSRRRRTLRYMSPSELTANCVKSRATRPSNADRVDHISGDLVLHRTGCPPRPRSLEKRWNRPWNADGEGRHPCWVNELARRMDERCGRHAVLRRGRQAPHGMELWKSDGRERERRWSWTSRSARGVQPGRACAVPTEGSTS